MSILPAVLRRAIAIGLLGTAMSLPVGTQSAPLASTAANAPAADAPSGVYYEIFVRAFADSNGDGIGDLNGITAKLDYLTSLGVSGLWLTPINLSPSYRGHDITDYYGINFPFGTTAKDRVMSQFDGNAPHMRMEARCC